MAEGVYGGPCVQHHSVAIFDRGGERRLWNLVDLTAIEWGRERDKKSSCTFTITGRACEEQADIIQKITDGTGRFEAVVYRAGERVWEGPLRTARTGSEHAVFLAADMKEYLDHTSLSKAWPNKENGGPPLMGDRLQQIIEYELTTPYTMATNAGNVTVKRWENLDPPINVVPFLDVRSGTVQTLSVTEEFEMKLGEHMDNLCDGGLDYTVVGRRVVLFDSALGLGQTRRMTDADFLGEVEVIRYGSEHWSISHLSATKDQGEDEAATRRVGHAGAEDPFYGVWENIVSQQSEESTAEPTQQELNTQANRDVLHRTPAPIEVRVPDGVGIRLTDTLGIAHLVPGVIIPVTTSRNIQTVSQYQQLDSLKVTEDASGEVVTVTMSPFGAVTA